MRQRFLIWGALALGLACQPALAQGWQARGGEAFVQNKARRSALIIECAQGGAIWLRIQNPTPWRANQPVAVRAGGRSFAMTIDGGADYVLLSNGPDIGISEELIGALKSGGALILDGPAAQRMSGADRTFPLAGAAPAIANVERSCGRVPAAAAAMSAPPGREEPEDGTALLRSSGAAPARGPGVAAQPRPAAPAGLPPAIAKVQADLRKECNGRAVFQPGFQKTADFNGDGIPDYILDYGKLICDGSSTMYCGSAGCTLDIYVSRGSGYRQGYGSNVRDWSVAQAGGRAVLVLGLHGSACGRSGADTCNRRLVWDGRQFSAR